MKNIAIYGAGGFGREIACLLNAINDIVPTWNLIGFFDDGLPIGTSNRYGKVLGGIDAVNNVTEELSIVISIATPAILEKLSLHINNHYISFPNIIAPNVNFFDMEATFLGKGNVIFFGCRISCDVVIGNFNILNGLISLGHDAQMGNYNVLGPSCRLSGESKIGNSNFLGVQSIILQGIKVGDNTRIGSNSVVIRNTKDGNLYMGNPAKIVTL